MNRIIADGEELDMYPKDRINLNIKINVISDISTRNSTYSNTVKIPKTDTNKRIFQYLGVLGNTSEQPYKKIRCQYITNDLPLITDGYFQIIGTTTDEFEIVLYDGVIDIAEAIKDKNLSDLELANSLFHYRSRLIVLNSLDNTSGYIYAFANNVKDEVYSINTITIDRMIPFVFVKTVFEAILDEAGYEYTGDIFNNEEFGKEVFSMGEGAEGNTMDFVKMFPSIKQTDFLKDVLNRYGLVMRLKDGVIEFASMENILSGYYGYVDWTYKLNEIKSEKYNTTYAQNNLFTYSYSDENNDEGDGLLYVNNETIDLRKTVYTSRFDHNINGSIYEFTEINVPDILVPILPLLEKKEEDEVLVLKPKKFNSGLFKIERRNNDFSVRDSKDDSSDLVTDKPEVLPVLSGTTWISYLNDNYTRFQNVLTNYKTIDIDLNLDSVDLHNLDLFKIYYLSQTGNYYYLNSVQSDGLNSKAELTQINEILATNTVIIPPQEASIIIISVSTYVGNPPYSYGSGISTLYEFVDYLPTSAYITYTQVDENDVPLGNVMTANLNVSEEFYNHGFLVTPETCGTYSVQITDPNTNIQSNIEYVEFTCEGEVDDDPSIDIISKLYENHPIGDEHIGYRFNNFTPQSATMLIRAYNYQTNQPEGDILTIPLTELSPDVEHIIDGITLPEISFQYQVRIITDTITHTVVTLL